jgi:putative RNA 2'-phosphotransferase
MSGVARVALYQPGLVKRNPGYDAIKICFNKNNQNINRTKNMNHEKNIVACSKFLSLILRHAPETIKLELDGNGWAMIDDIIRLSKHHGKPISLELIQAAVASNDKKRFAISEDGLRIRARQGHSIANIDLNMTRRVPPEFLFHGTASRFVNSIRESGLKSGSRNHVHMSHDNETAIRVGSRHGSPVVLVIKALEMHTAGHCFYQSENGVWLTEYVPTQFLELPKLQ